MAIPNDNSPIPKRESWRMFDDISPRYDLLNHLLSFGLHIPWRKALVQHLPQNHDLRILDLATGTADVLITALAERGVQIYKAQGIDLAEKMLDIGRAKIAKRGWSEIITLSRGDAAEIPFDDEAYDAVSMSFGIRNVENPAAVLKEMQRVLRPGGRALILEFSLPEKRVTRAAHLFYLRHMVPLIGAMFSGHYQAYRYLNKTVENFPYGEAFCNLMREAGFQRVQTHPLLMGTATIYIGEKGNLNQTAAQTASSAKLISREDIKGKVAYFIRSLPRHPRATRPRYQRVEWECEPMDELTWLHNQTDPKKVYWSHRDHTWASAGVGAAHVVQSNETSEAPRIIAEIQKELDPDLPGLRYYGGMSFTEESCDELWKDFGCVRFVLPRFEMIREANRNIFAINFLFEDVTPEGIAALHRDLDALNFSDETVYRDVPRVISRQDTPEAGDWRRMVRLALTEIHAKQYLKIVLARRSAFEFDKPIKPDALIKHLKDMSPGCFHFCLQIDEHRGFLGATPERLYLKDIGRFATEAVAGTAKEGAAAGEDLKRSEKNQKEHAFVVRDLQESLEKLGADHVLNRGSDLMQLRDGHHLFTPLEASVPAALPIDYILKTLHPTSAVGGYPKEPALAAIRRLEPFGRGWYAGPIGVISNQQSEFVVAIRSGLIDAQHLYLYAGAGIVEGSKPDQEWEEIEQKISNFIRVFDSERTK